MLSGLGSLPLHLLPFLVAVAVAGGVLSTAMAGWIGAAYMLGLLTTSSLLPVCGVERLSRAQAAIAVATLAGALFLAGRLVGAALVLVNWLLVGVACGVLQVMGAMAAAHAEHRHDAFALRLAITLAIAGMTTAALQLTGAFASYAALARSMALITCAIASLALLLPMPRMEATSSRLSPPAGGGTRTRWQGLLFIGLFFVGQHGLWAYTVEGAIGNGIDVSTTAVNISLCKFAACAFLLTRNFGLSRRWPDPTLSVGGMALAVSASIVIATSSTSLLLLGLLVWQVALNTMSARFQAEVVSVDPANAGAWITAAIYLGSALGYVLRGAAIALGVDVAFQALIVVSCFLPALWMWRAKVRQRAPQALAARFLGR
jgi:hypothetical protein